MSLKRTAITGAKWTTVSSIVRTGLQFLQVAVLARYLAPTDFGLMAMLMIVLGFAQAYADMGVSSAIIYHQDTTDDQLASLYWLNVGGGVIVSALLLLATPAVVALYHEPRLAPLMPWASAIFLVTPFGQQYLVLFEKNLAFDRLAFIEAGSTVVGTVVAVVAAIRGSGVYALVWGQLATSASRALLLAGAGHRRWPHRLHFRWKDCNGYLSFGAYQIGERTANYLAARLDQLLVGALLGAQPLGYYNLAWSLVIQPITKINPILTRVAFPVFARVQDDIERLRRGFLTLSRMLALVNVPLLIGLAATAPAVVRVLYGDGWQPVVPLVQVLALVALLRSSANPVGSLLLARGRADLGFKWSVAILLVMVPTVYFSTELGRTLGVAIGLLGLQIVLFGLGYYFLIRPMIGRCWGQFLGTVVPALSTAIFMAVPVYLLSHFVQVPRPILLGMQIALGVAIYIILTWISRRDELRETLHLVLRA
ncbi:MAG TPA: MOP flippase family protein [Gemmatimonadaceae bacterium]|nr:MOP flippase family protein [Gemmatimonadaceae bacterium]